MAEEYIGQDEPEGLSEKAAKYGITGSRFDNLRFPIKGGAMISGQDDESVPSHLADVQAELRAIRASMPPMGAALSQAQTAREVTQAQESISRQVRDSIDRLGQIRLAHFGEVNTKRLEADLSELNKRAFGMQATLGGYGSTQYSAIGPSIQPLREMTDQMRQGQRFTEYQQRQAIEQASRDRARVALDPNLSESVKRYYTGQIATEQRRLQDIGRFSVLETPRGMPDEGLANRFPGLRDRFQGMQDIRQRIEAGRDTSGRLTDERQRQLRGEIDLEQRLLRIEEQRIRAQGEMTKEVQHQFNVQNSELNRTRRDMERGPAPIMTPAGVTRMVGQGGGRAVLGQAIQQMAFNRGDTAGTGTLSMLGGMIAAQGFGGAAIRGLEMGGSQAALGVAGLGMRGLSALSGGAIGPAIAGPAAGIIGGLGAMAVIPAVGAVAGGLAGVLSQVQPSAQHGMEVERLYRAGGAGGGLAGRQGITGIGGVTGNFLSGYYQEILNAGQAQEGREGANLSFSRDDVLQVAGTLARVGGTEGPGGLGRDRIRPVLEFARYMGTGAQETAQQFGLMERNDLLRNPGAPGARPEQDQKRFADLIAQSIAQSGMRGREQEVLGAVTGLTSSIAQRGLDVNVDRIMSLVTTLNREGGPGLRGQAGQEALSTINEGIIGARGPQQAMLYNIYRQAAAKQGRHHGPMDFLGEQAAGLGSDFAMEGVQNITDLAHGNMNLAAGFLTAQYAGGDLHQFGRMRRLAQLAQDRRLTPEELARTQQELERGGPGGAGMQGAGVAVGTTSEGVPSVGVLGNAEQLNSAMVTLTNTFEDAASSLQPLLTSLTGVASNMMLIVNNVIKMFSGGGVDLGNLPGFLQGIGDRALGGLTGLPGGLTQGRIGANQSIYGAQAGQATLAALPHVGAAGVGRRLSDLTGGQFTSQNVQALRNQRQLLVPQGGEGPGADSAELVSAFNAAFPNAADEVPPYDELVSFYNRWVEQHRGNIPEAKGIAQEHLSGLAERWAGVTYDMNGPGRNATSLEGVHAAGNTTDCSGFVTTVLRSAGVGGLPQNANLDTTAYLNNAFTAPVERREDIQAGDVIVSGGSGAGAHMGIYTGGGQVTHIGDNRGVRNTPVDQFLASRGDYQIRRLRSVQNAQGGVNIPNAMAGLNILGMPAADIERVQAAPNGPGTIGGIPATGASALNISGVSAGLRQYLPQLQEEAGRSGLPLELYLATAMGENFSADLSRVGDNGRSVGIFQQRYPGEGQNSGLLQGALQMNVPAQIQNFTRYATPAWQRVQRAVAAGQTQIEGLPISTYPQQIAAAAALAQRPESSVRGRYLPFAQGLLSQNTPDPGRPLGIPGIAPPNEMIPTGVPAETNIPDVTNTTAPGGGRITEETTSPTFIPGITDPAGPGGGGGWPGITGSIPMDSSAMLAQQQMININFGLATVRIEDMEGRYLGQGNLPVQIDAADAVNRDPMLSTMGYVG